MALALSVENIDIELVVTLDPVARKLRRPPVKPGNVKTWLNVYVDYSNEQCNKCGHLIPNDVAMRGGPWQFCAGAKENNTYVNPKDPCWSHANAAAMFQYYQREVENVN